MLKLVPHEPAGNLPKYLSMALDEIRAHVYEKRQTYNLAAVLVQGNQVLSVGFNSLNVNGFVSTYAKYAIQKDKPFWTHAELDAIQKVRRKSDLTGAKIFVARLTPVRKLLGMSRPCESCEVLAQNYGIKRVYYTIDDNHYGIMNVVDSTDKIIRT